jgi:hypothetical protein
MECAPDRAVRVGALNEGGAMGHPFARVPRGTSTTGVPFCRNGGRGGRREASPIVLCGRLGLNSRRGSGSRPARRTLHKSGIGYCGNKAGAIGGKRVGIGYAGRPALAELNFLKELR